MSKVSIILPSRNERFLPQTIQDAFKKAAGEIEVIAVLDGYWPDPPLLDRPNLTLIHRGTAKGMRAAINAGAAISHGDYIMKCDAHVAFAEGFDEVLKENCDGDWVVIPRRYSLDAETWTCREKEAIDYHYLDCPMTNQEYYQFHGVPWMERTRERRNKPEYDLDETLSWQGSFWFTPRQHWYRIGPLSEYGYGTFSQEPQEVGMKTWLGGGKLMTCKRTWLAHLHKGHQYGRMYSMNMNEVKQGHIYSAWYWTTNQWTERVHDFEWLIDHFWPLPKWPENWQEQLDEYQQAHLGGFE